MLKIGQDAQTQHKALKELISHHDHCYYVLDQPEISDFEYDELFSLLLKMEKENSGLDISDSPSQRVGGKPLEAFQKAEHRQPMLSLTNSYEPKDIEEFDIRVKKFLNRDAVIEYFCEPKFDGLALELVFEKGVLIRAITRGDGLVGEDVTLNIRTVRSIPIRLLDKNPPDLVEVRGEIVMFKSDFADLNSQQQELGLPTFANPRNAAAGSIRQLDSTITAGRRLHFFAYALGSYSEKNLESHDLLEKQLARWGFSCADSGLTRVTSGANNTIAFYHHIETLRYQLPYEIDGMVIKVNSLSLQEELGMVARSPRWATAAKYQPQQVETTIIDIQVQVGRTGALTPVAIMKPAKVGGVTIVNATLHNQDEIDRKDIRIGDTVVLQRAGDVIPEVVRVVKEKRPENTKPFHISPVCPTCKTPALRAEGEVVLRCQNQKCPAIILGSLLHFVSRRAMNIEKIGDKVAESLVSAGLVTKFSDLYHLKKSDLLENLSRQGEKSTENIIKSIDKSRKTSLPRLIYALGIRFVGEQTAKALAKHFLNMERFIDADLGALQTIPDIGPRVSASILEWLKSSENINDLQELRKELQIEEVATVQTGPLSGRSFLVTGTLPVTRDVAQEMIEKSGGKLLSAVSSKLNYLVVGDSPGGKLEKATRLGVQILNWEDFLKLLQSGPTN